MSDVIKPGNLWNPVIALRRMGADTSLLSCMVDYFLEDSQLLLRDLKQRIDAGDAPEASRLAHSLKSICCNIEADDATRAGILVEAACMAETLDEASALMPPLTEQVRRLSAVLSLWRIANPQGAE
jgi:HPt (histidine-containing phosphotransfer) domain-containing protein